MVVLTAEALGARMDRNASILICIQLHPRNRQPQAHEPSTAAAGRPRARVISKHRETVTQPTAGAAARGRGLWWLSWRRTPRS